jgi:hypothetical protein
MTVTAFVLGIFAGVVIGVVVMALVSVNRPEE